MSLCFVSSMNKGIYDEYGKRFIDECLSYASSDLSLIIVFEGDIPSELASKKRLECLPLAQSNHHRFLKFFGNLYEANGVKIKRSKQPNGQIATRLEREFRFDARRFSFKIFSLRLARTHLGPTLPFAWLDADMRCLQTVTWQDILPFMPDQHQVMSYLGRTAFPPDAPYSECGFLGFNPAHPELDAYLGRMEDLYLTGEFFTKKQWHDSWLWDEVRREFEARGSEFKNISGSAETLEHPFINTGLGQFFDHLKGPTRKKQGRSFDRDYRSVS